VEAKEERMDDSLRRFHIRSCVRDALSRHGISHDNPMRAELEANATIAAGDDSRVIGKNGNSLDVEIQSRLNSPRMNESFPTASRTVAKTDADSLRKNFDDIAAGKVRVTE
jgi:ribosomal protein S3